ncbi:hypothetical protein DMUE_5945 [Dictyocoela muelleri]|nr:hypothetical protein DMUE_5945 [Dictyocoela muelleri]
MLKRLNRAPDHEFFSYISLNENVLEFLIILEAIPSSKVCIKCDKNMIIKQNEKYTFKYCWKCSKCKKTINILNDCVLGGKKIPPFIFFKFAFYFFNRNNFTADYIQTNCEIGEEKYKILLKIFRDKISQYIHQNWRPLGNVLKEVQIDETFWAKR